MCLAIGLHYCQFRVRCRAPQLCSHWCLLFEGRGDDFHKEVRAEIASASADLDYLRFRAHHAKDSR